MKKVLPHITALFLSSCLICGCTFEDETEEKIALPEKESVPDTALNSQQNLFQSKTKECILGNFDSLDEIVRIYQSSLGKNDRPKESTQSSLEFEQNRLTDPNLLYQFQTRDLSIGYDNCLQKAISSNHMEYRGNFITRGRVAARIAQHFYANDNIKEASYWQLRVLNMSGLSQGYYILGSIFVKNEKTLKTGAELLTEAAKLGNTSAEQYLNDNAVFLNVFDKLSQENR